jgi:hypothetical protein
MQISSSVPPFLSPFFSSNQTENTNDDDDDK